MIGQFSKITTAIFVTLYLQDALKFSPMAAGGIALTAFIASPVAAPFAGKAADKYGPRRPALTGLSFASLSTMSVAAAIHFDSLYALIPSLLIWGAALPFWFVPSVLLVMSTVPEERRGEVSGISTTLRQTGGTMGMTLGSVILAATGHFMWVFLTAGAIIAAVLVFAFFALKPSDTQVTASDS